MRAAAESAPWRFCRVLLGATLLVTALVTVGPSALTKFSDNLVMLDLARHIVTEDMAAWLVPGDPPYTGRSRELPSNVSPRVAAVCQFWRGDFWRVPTLLSGVCADDPKDLHAALYLGASLWASDSPDAAGAVWRASSGATFLSYFIGRSGRYCDSGDQSQALAFLDMAESIAPGDGRVFLEHGLIARAFGKPHDELLYWFELAASSPPYPADAFQGLADAYSAAGQYSDSVAVLRRGNALYPDRFLYPLGRDLVRLGRYAEAVGVLCRCVELSPGNASAWKRLGLAQNAVGDSEGSVESLLSAGSLYEQSGQAQVATDVYCQILQFSSSESRATERLIALGAQCP